MDESADFVLFVLSVFIVAWVIAPIRLLELPAQQLPSCDIEVDESAGNEEPVGILLQVSVADLDGKVSWR